MGKYFSDNVEQALNYIYYDMSAGNGKEGLRLLEEASAAGDGDASCILARCLSGPNYIWAGHHFPIDDKRASQLYRLSVEQGSAIGVLVSMRCGELTPELMDKMPIGSLGEAFDIVLKKADEGSAFCQYLIGNVYFWWDFMEIWETPKFNNNSESNAYLAENISKCEEWFLKSLRGGMYSAASNLNKYYREGEKDLIAPQPEKADGVYKLGAELGYPPLQYHYGEILEEAGDAAGAFHWYELALKGGEPLAWYDVGKAYEEGKLVAENLDYAMQCYKNGFAEPVDSGSKVGCANNLGYAYFNGIGAEQDYSKAFTAFKYAYDHNSNWGIFYLGKCYFYGLGTPQNYAKAIECLSVVKNKYSIGEAHYMLGYMYCRGLGTAEDIKKGVEYLQSAGNFPDAKEELRNYKKTLLGKWVRR